MAADVSAVDRGWWGPALVSAVLLAWLSVQAQRLVYNLYYSPLTCFPGPKIAAATTLWKAFIECILQRSFLDVLVELHARNGDVVRIGPNELHFAQPQAYHDIYNNKNRWDKDERLYHSFGQDRSSFGFLSFKEARERRDVVGRMFSPKAMEHASGLVLDKVRSLCAAFKRQSLSGRPVDLFLAYRCMTLDVITYLSFGHSVDAINAPDFHAPVVEAMDATLPVSVCFKHAHWFKNMLLNCPPRLARIVSPATVGVVNLQQLIKKQISELPKSPRALEHLPHNMTVYHQLLNKEAYRTNTVPSEDSLFEETMALMFAGGDTTGHTLMVGSFHLVQKQPQVYARLKEELLNAWPRLEEDEPTLRSLEKLPYLTAVIKEALRMDSGVVSGLLRVVPDTGTTIDGKTVPGGTVVSCGSTFVHWNSSIFPQPHDFKPERWLNDSSLENWLVPFSRGPRTCLGMNLAWAELRLCFAHVFRKFDLEPDDSSPDELLMRETFLPLYYGPHAKARVTPVKA